MPVLEKISISDFRNIELQELSFSPNVNCICGDNGEGKTNLIDAIYYLSMTKSAFAATDRFNFRHGTCQFSICGSYRMENGLQSKFSIVTAQTEKKMKRDGKVYDRISSHIGVLPVVMVSPSDSSLVSESGDERRRFVNSVLSQMDRGYMNSLQQYNRLLLQRNRMLKDSVTDPTLLSVIDSRMAAFAEPVYIARKKFAGAIEPLVRELYGKLCGGSGESGQVGIEYSSELEGNSLEDLFSARRERDMALRYTGSGIQRDDFVFTIDGYPLRRCGSQGQQKSFLVALKFAQYELMKEAYGFAPVLLLDDVFDKLDTGRMSNLLEVVSSDKYGQIFITDCNKERLRNIIDRITEERTYYKAEKGVFTPIL